MEGMDEVGLAEVQAGLANPVTVFAFRRVGGDIEEEVLEGLREGALIVTKDKDKVLAVLPNFGEVVEDWTVVEEEMVEE